MKIILYTGVIVHDILLSCLKVMLIYGYNSNVTICLYLWRWTLFLVFYTLNYIVIRTEYTYLDLTLILHFVFSVIGIKVVFNIL